jgi:hypothetical protein
MTSVDADLRSGRRLESIIYNNDSIIVCMLPNYIPLDLNIKKKQYLENTLTVDLVKLS